MMTFAYQSTSATEAAHPADASLWHLGAGQALSLPSQPGERQLRVDTGRVWVTFSAPAQVSARQPSTPREAVDLPLADRDHWLCAGQTLRLPAHASVVLEGWPQAAFSLREMPPQASMSMRGLAQKTRRLQTQPPLAGPEVRLARLVRAICGRVGVPGRCEAAALT